MTTLSGIASSFQTEIVENLTPTVETFTGKYFNGKPVYIIQITGTSPAVVTPVSTGITGVDVIISQEGWSTIAAGWQWTVGYKLPISGAGDMVTSLGFGVNPADDTIYIRAEGAYLNQTYEVSLQYTKI